jgi:hypothetical protein
VSSLPPDENDPPFIGDVSLFWTDDQGDAIAEQIGMPAGAPWRRIIERPGTNASAFRVERPIRESVHLGESVDRRWKSGVLSPLPRELRRRFFGWTCEYFGQEVPWDSEDPPPWPAWTLNLSDPWNMTIQIWRQRAWLPDSHIYAEIRWHPDLEKPEDGIFGFTAPYHETHRGEPVGRKELTEGQKGLRLLHALRDTNAGAPSKLPSTERFCAMIDDLYARASQQGWRLREKNNEWIRFALGPPISAEQARRLKHRDGISIDDIRRGQPEPNK